MRVDRGQPVGATLLAAVLYVLSGVAITAGYHRLFAHRTYRGVASRAMGDAGVRRRSISELAVSWSADHRAHDADTDRAADPHAVTCGIWFAHMGWLFHRRVASADVRRLDDLVAAQRPLAAPLLPRRGGGDRAPRARWRSPRRGAIRGVAFSWPASSAASCCRQRSASTGSPISWEPGATTGSLGTRQHAHGDRHVRRGLPRLPPSLPVRLSQRDRWWHYDPSKWLLWDAGSLAADHQGALGVAVHHRPSCGHDSRPVRQGRRLTPS